MFGLLKSLVANLLMPLPVALLLMLVGAWMAIRGWRRVGFAALFGGFLLVFLASWSPVADRWLEPLEHAYSPVLDTGALTGVAAVVVLGSGWEPGQDWPASTRLTESSLYRLTEGLRLLQQLPEAQLVVTGGSRRSGVLPIAQGYAEAARSLGVASDRIVVLDKPTDTAQEAYAVREYLGTEARFLLVTSASHMPRSMRHFERVGLAPIPAPTHFLTGREKANPLRYWVPSADGLRKTERAVYEYLGLLALEWDHRR
jgi:uncharacterized SAM-binding protein YcdF (DUF218 family)